MEEKLCNTIQEFEDIFGNVPFKDLDKIKKHIKNNFIPISLIEKKILMLDMRIKHLRKELEKSCEERETLGTETDIDNNEAYIFHIEEELNHRCAERNALRKLLDERSNTDD